MIVQGYCILTFRQIGEQVNVLFIEYKTGNWHIPLRFKYMCSYFVYLC